jgi:hypothetical protein
MISSSINPPAAIYKQVNKLNCVPGISPCMPPSLPQDCLPEQTSILCNRLVYQLTSVSECVPISGVPGVSGSNYAQVNISQGVPDTELNSSVTNNKTQYPNFKQDAFTRKK